MDEQHFVMISQVAAAVEAGAQRSKAAILGVLRHRAALRTLRQRLVAEARTRQAHIVLRRGLDDWRTWSRISQVCGWPSIGTDQQHQSVNRQQVAVTTTPISSPTSLSSQQQQFRGIPSCNGTTARPHMLGMATQAGAARPQMLE